MKRSVGLVMVFLLTAGKSVPARQSEMPHCLSTPPNSLPSSPPAGFIRMLRFNRRLGAIITITRNQPHDFWNSIRIRSTTLMEFILVRHPDQPKNATPDFVVGSMPEFTTMDAAAPKS